MVLLHWTVCVPPEGWITDSSWNSVTPTLGSIDVDFLYDQLSSLGSDWWWHSSWRDWKHMLSIILGNKWFRRQALDWGEAKMSLSSRVHLAWFWDKEVSWYKSTLPQGSHLVMNKQNSGMKLAWLECYSSLLHFIILLCRKSWNFGKLSKLEPDPCPTAGKGGKGGSLSQGKWTRLEQCPLWPQWWHQLGNP